MFVFPYIFVVFPFGCEVKSSAGLVAPSLPTLFTHAANHPQATLASFALQTAPQVFTQENLATLFTGVMAPTGTVSQPVLIPITIPGQMSGQQGLALWNFPTTTLATIPGLAAAPPAGGMFKLPLANLQAAPVLNTALQTPVQAAPALQAIYQAQPAVQAPSCSTGHRTATGGATSPNNSTGPNSHGVQQRSQIRPSDTSYCPACKLHF
ncbi:unnamed protein product [Ranitomeya imitator]|uniref:Uncharacterized protein n=1 Tax=Ranitomeya imitator TaxID=111125 RepID=A0ABN9KNF9_9NEOB|nr:unnamed protein product [Ranitomeya imitator]